MSASMAINSNAGMDWLRNRISRLPKLFYITVFFPTLIAIIYYGLIAAKIYVSDSQFIVKSPYKATSSSLLSQMVASGASGASQESYSVIEYLQSRDALRQLNKADFIAKEYSEHGDWIGRFHPGWNGSFEALWRYYKHNIVVPTLDEQASTIHLEVNAYTAADAKNINEASIELAEQLVNEMNARAARDAERFEGQEVARAEDKAKQASSALAAYRVSHTVFDPDHQSTLQLQQATSLQTQMFAAQAQLSGLMTVSPANPQVEVLKNKVQKLEDQFNASKNEVVGREGSLSEKAAEYSKLQLDAEFAARQWGSAMAGLELARAQAQKQQVYLERIVQPNLPDEAIKPKRIRGILTVLIAGLVLWAILSLLTESVREHRD